MQNTLIDGFLFILRWVNRKDPNGRNLFGGGFLGLDNIGLFDRSRPLPVAGQLEQVCGVCVACWLTSG